MTAAQNRQATERIATCRGVWFAYDKVPVLEDVQLAIYRRESVCMVGPNGGGKSTLVKLMLGLLSPDQGEIRLFGTRPADAVLRVGYVPQYAHFDLRFPVTVLDVVLMGSLTGGQWGGYGREARQRALSALAKLRMDSFHNRPFAALSGGQRQRVLIARALAATTEFLVLDEPTAFIDPAAEEGLFELLRELRRLTILVVTHDLGFVSQFFERVICVNRQVVVHPTSDISGEMISEMYGGDIRMIRHDHHCSERGHFHG